MTDDTEVFPTSHAQERLWTVTRLAGDSSAYSMTATLQLDGPLDVAALDRALHGAIGRHAALRTGFEARDGVPVQVVHPAVPFAVRHTDLTDAGEAVLREQLAEDAAEPFDLATPPLLRVRLVRLAAERHVLGLCLHHIVADGWSIALLLDDVAAGYAAAIEGRAHPLPPPAVGYGEFARRQRTDGSPERRDELHRFWADQLDGAPEVLALPTDRPRAQGQTQRGAMVAARVPAAVRDALTDLVQDEQATLFMALLAGYTTVLARNSGQPDVVVGTAVADRGDPDFADVVGLFVDTLAVRVDLAGLPGFRTLLHRVRDRCLAAYEHQDLSFQQLVELVAPPRTATHHPIFQVMLTLQGAAGIAPDLPGLTVTELPPAISDSVAFDLNLSVHNWADGLELRLWYSTDLFDESTGRRLLDQLSRVLTAAAANPDRPVSLLPLLDDDERRALLAGTPAGPAPEECLPALVEAQARRTPDAVAVTAEAGRVTYGELDVRANRLAHRLRESGVGAETLVGLAVRRGTDFVTAIQAVWRAGGAFVPLDPDQPPARQRAMLSQADCPVLLVDDAGRAGLAEVLAELSPVLIDVNPAAHEDRPADPLPPRYRPNGLAYVMFTSGTTGTPKGAMVTHDGMLNHVVAKNGDVGMSEADTLAQNGPATFDVVVWQCCAPLVLGGRVHVVPDGAAADPQLLADELAAGEVTVLQAVPAVIGLLLTLPAPDRRLITLRWLVSTGDALPTDLAARWVAAYQDIALLNTYGVTECSDDQYHGVVRPDRERTPVAAIGAPVANMSGYVLDGELEPVPAGVIGELYLGGLGVGRGYLGRPGRTADRFVPDPHGVPGARAYRTGDLVRRHASGSVEFLGRNDFQLKVRGFRIEPGDVVAALCEHPAVRDAVVVGHGPAGPDRLLAGYAVPADERVPIAELHRFLADRLPAYLRPHHLMWLDDFPLTRNGKLDRAALPPPVPEDVPAGQTPSGDSIADLVAQVWRRVLGRDVIGAHEEFFRVGGTSLLAVELLERLRVASGVRLTIAELLRDATVAGIAETVRLRLRDGRAGPSLDPIPAIDRTGPLPVSFAQERMWVIDRITESPALYVVPFAVRVRVDLDDAALAAVVDRLVARHDALRTGLVERDGRPAQVVHPTVPTPLTVDDLSGLDKDARAARATRLLTDDARAGFDLGRPPLLRIRALRLADGEVVLGIVAHHAITDAWSNDILVRDLVELLHAADEHRAPALPELTVQYPDHAAWQRRELSSARLDELLAHWSTRLAGLPELCTLPGDRPRPAAQSHRGAHEGVLIPAEVAARARALGRAEGATTFMIALAALYVALHRHGGERDLVVGTPVAGRDHPQSHEVVGCFVNTLPLRYIVPGRPSFREVLRGVREVCLDAYAHADLPFEALVERLAPRRSMAQHPFFQVLLSMLSLRPGETGRLAFAEDLPVADTGTAKFDLGFQVVESDDGWQVRVEYATDLYDPDSVRRFGTALGELLAAATAEPDRPISLLPLLPGTQWQEMEAWRTGPVRHASPDTLPGLVAAQVARMPDAPALGAGNDWLSYREFWARVTALSARLRAQGAGADTVVGICLERGVDQVVAVHAVLAAGAAYLPLDPDHPRDRLVRLARDAGAELVVGSARLNLFDGVRLVAPDGGHTDGEPPVSVHPDCLAYTIYTSGSTGAPKGVQITHRGIVNRVLAMRDDFPLGPGDRVLHKTPFGFDVSMWELFWPLVTGAAVVLAPPGAQRDPRALLDQVTAERVGSLHFVPSMLGPFLDTIADTGVVPSALRRVVCSGEALPAALADRFHRTLPGVELHTLYGPTETVVEMTWQPLVEPGTDISIGRPIVNTRVEVLDEEGQRVPPGVTGELHVGGVQLARGYAGRPGLTAARFQPDPYGTGERLYATGDLGRWRTDGAIEVLGRRDDQVKIRGFRVEPAEVEAALRADQEVRAAAVVAREGRLVAYVVPESGPLDVSRLRRTMAERLPDYLQPSSYVSLPELPVTANGKLDRAALPAPVAGRDGAGTEYVAPADGPEQVLAGIWARVLGVDKIGARDNFFDLGGDSIMSLLVVSQAARAGLRVTPRQFFEHQTVADLAALATATDSRPARRLPAGRVDTATFGRVVALLRAEDELRGHTDDDRA